MTDTGTDLERTVTDLRDAVITYLAGSARVDGRYGAVRVGGFGPDAGRHIGYVEHDRDARGRQTRTWVATSGARYDSYTARGFRTRKDAVRALVTHDVDTDGRV